MEVIKIKMERNEIDNRKSIEIINYTKSWFFEKIDKIGKPLPRMTKKRREKTQITKITEVGTLLPALHNWKRILWTTVYQQIR